MRDTEVMLFSSKLHFNSFELLIQFEEINLNLLIFIGLSSVHTLKQQECFQIPIRLTRKVSSMKILQAKVYCIQLYIVWSCIGQSVTVR